METYELNRRELLRLGLATGVMCLFGGEMSATATLLAHNALDHLLLGVSDLDQGIAWVENKTGVKAVVGGTHPGAGTRNALVSLGRKQYLEIIAPDPAQTNYNFQIDIRTLKEPRLITWAAATNDIEALAKSLLKSGMEIFGPRAGSRARPDGKILKWKTLGVKNQWGQPPVEPIPFFIQWAADSLHPSQDSPKGCELQSFEIQHPDPSGVTELQKKLDIDATVTRADNARLKATLKTPKGLVDLT